VSPAGHAGRKVNQYRGTGRRSSLLLAGNTEPHRRRL